jgi:hypothetical protein
MSTEVPGLYKRAHAQCLQEEDCSPFTVMPEEAPALDAQAVAELAAKCKAAVSACNASGDGAAEAVRSRLLLLQHLHAVRGRGEVPCI